MVCHITPNEKTTSAFLGVNQISLHAAEKLEGGVNLKVVREGEVIYAMLDGKWDMRNQRIVKGG